MLPTLRARSAPLLAAGALLALPALAVAQSDIEPTNDLPNPYQTTHLWGDLPDGREWGSTSAIYVDPDGQHIWVGERCGQNTCVTSDLDPILKFDQDGNLVTSFGGGLIVWPHGFHVDYEGNVWITDARSNQSGQGVPDPPPAEVHGHQVHKFSPDGEHLMTLGEPGGERMPGHFWQPNDVYVAPSGDIFVAEGHSNNPAQADARILKFDSEGNYLMEWGQMGDGPEDLMQPHALAMDSQGRLFVGDRSNDRIQIYDQEGNLLDSWYQFGRPSGLFIDEFDNLYVADSESGSLPYTQHRTDWMRGLRIGSARTGEVRYIIPDPNLDCFGTCTAEGVTVDANGVVYGAWVGPVGGVRRHQSLFPMR